jgi:hypothetical protein
VPWRRFLGSRTTWLLWAQYFFFSYCWYFYVTWLPKFLKDSYGADHGKVYLAMLAGIPLFAGGLGNLRQDASCRGSPRAWAALPPARPADRGIRTGRCDVGLRRAPSR